nr:immunoglobulin heavy chain junction region [Macaca mulatta]MOV88026.1 immunoglobulin heavy chain junction region [Macaca mulatta]MOV90652.1 immunoglobulin heavy chain junction region [Macaca mulatta]MOV90965.1 immunoglobulin heavy chain junction region [Macaca mulatta]
CAKDYYGSGFDVW